MKQKKVQSVLILKEIENKQTTTYFMFQTTVLDTFIPGGPKNTYQTETFFLLGKIVKK